MDNERLLKFRGKLGVRDYNKRERLKLIKKFKPEIDLNDEKAVKREDARQRQVYNRYKAYA